MELDGRVHKEMVVGYHEPHIVRVIEAQLRRGGLAFDVGAHLGYFTLLMARIVGDEGKVVALEPDPKVFAILGGNLARNPGFSAGCVIPVQAAVGGREGEAQFAEGLDSSTGKLSPEGRTAVLVTTLDRLSRCFGVPHLVKMDIEGGEVEAIRGAQSVLAARQTTFVIEAHTPTLDGECRALLDAGGYACEHLWRGPAGATHILCRPRE